MTSGLHSRSSGSDIQEYIVPSNLYFGFGIGYFIARVLRIVKGL